MLDFLYIRVKPTKNGGMEIEPKFIVKKSKDLMVMGGKFYAMWDQQKHLWTTDPFRAIELVDYELDSFKNNNDIYKDAHVLHLWDSDSGSISKWHRYIEHDMWDSYIPLDTKIQFAGKELKREDYASKQLSYPLEKGPYEAWKELTSVLYFPEELHKIEWCIGCIISGDSKDIQKFLVLYGSGGTGKGTVIEKIEKLFEGYCKHFSSKDLGSSNAAFAMEPLAENPLVAIDSDGKLDRIEDNTRLNSIVAHDIINVNKKHANIFSMRFNSFLIIATNNPVRITDAKSGLIRRLIDASPTGNLLPKDKYETLMSQIDFELPGIAYHCLEVYRENPRFYDKYIPEKMLGETNDFYNFVIESYDHYKTQNWTTLNESWERYNEYVKNAKIPYPYSQMRFKAELKNYFESYSERSRVNGKQVWHYYSGFKSKLFTDLNGSIRSENSVVTSESWIEFQEQPSLFDIQFASCKAQYANDDGTPIRKWVNVDTDLKDIDTSKVHYVRVPEQLVVIDFDLKDENGEKSYEKNLEAASKWTRTYAELSKSGSGIHLHYIFNGDVNELSRVYGDNIEIKVFTGNSSLRRKLTKCNDIPIATLSSGLPFKEGGKKVFVEAKFKSEKALRDLIERNLRKEIMHYTKPSIDFIAKILEDAYDSGTNYDVRDLRPAITAFANESSNQADYCLRKVLDMKFSSAEPSPSVAPEEDRDIVFFDVEVFPNLFVVCWKTINGMCVRWINPTSIDICELMKYRLVGFNNRRYDNHILWARSMGYDNAMLYDLSQRIINNSPNAFFGEAYGISYTDIFDFSSEKKSLKKFEIDYGIHHQELGLAWDQEVPEELWDKVAEYCENDVIATQVVWEKRQGDFLAREILADITGMTVNDTTNSLTTRLIFGNNRHPQNEFVYTHLGGSEESKIVQIESVISPVTGKRYPVNPNFTCADETTGQMIFPGYTCWHEDEYGNPIMFGGRLVSRYRGVEVGEGGYVLSDPGIWFNVKVKDVTSMHPNSTKQLNLFGDTHTKTFADLVGARVAIKKGMKTGDFSEVSSLFDGKLMKYLDDPSKAKMLSNALKIAINSVYGLTAAKFDNPFRDPRNYDNIVAKRGALFMVNLKNEVEDKGGHVIHIKTDSIKVENMTPEIEDFIIAYGHAYGYSFETEHVFEKFCLVNKSVYIAKCAADDPETPGQWTATGAQFAVPYVFKTLFTDEPIVFEDMVQTVNVSTALYLDMNENLPDVTELEKQKEKLEKQLKAGKITDITPIIDLENRIELGHNYIFVGKVGAFCPIQKGKGGGWLVRKGDDKYDAATGCKDFRWLEAETVKALHKEDDIDRGFYTRLVDEAVATINEYGDFESFID